MKSLIGSLISLILSVSVSAEPLIEGQVRLDSGEPVAEAQVRLFDLSDLSRGAIARAQTDGTGYFALPLAALTASALPEGFALGPNYPNPFNPSTIIPYKLAASSEVRLEVFNLLGQRIATLVDGERSAGFHTATWHATDAAGRAVGTGVYIYRMTVGVKHQTGRMVLIDGQAGVSTGGIASVLPGTSGGGGPNGEREEYGLIVSGSGLVPYVDSSFRVEAGMAPVELVVSSGHWGDKAADDDCAFCDLFDALNDEAEGPGPSGKAQATFEAPPAPTNLRFEAVTDSSCTVRWDTAEGATDYDVNYKRAVGGKWTNEPHRGTGLYNTINDLEPRTEYRWAVRAENGDGPSAWVFGPNFTTVGVDGQVTIPDAKLRAAIEDALDKASGAPITVAEMETLVQLSVSLSRDFRDLTGLEFAANLEYLWLSGRKITDLSPLAGLTNLKELWLGSCEISDSIASALVGFDQLEILYIGRNRITDVSLFAGLTNLKELSLGENNITDISPLANLTNLKELGLGINNITDISPLANLTNLRRLYLGKNNITDISPLAGLTNLTDLDLALNEINNITDISPLAGLTNLGRLYLGGNRITDVSPLAGLTNLRELWLSGNNLTDISPLAGLTNLERLGLTWNNLTDVSPLLDIASLQYAHLRANPLSTSSITDYIPSLIGQGLVVYFDPPPRESDFDIDLVFLDPFTEEYKRVFQYAARRWESIITEDLPDHEFIRGWSGRCGHQSYEIPAGERIDDLRIYVVDGEYSTSSSPSWGYSIAVRETSHLPSLGCISIGNSRSSINRSLGTALHEIGHVMGIGVGPLWSDFTQNISGERHFNGPRAIAAFNDAGGWDYVGAKVPVESDEWQGSGSHWRSSVFGERWGWGELMDWQTTSAGEDIGALSAITIQALADFGYSVDVAQADYYTLPDAAAAKASAKIATPSTHTELEWSCGTDQVREPIYVVDPQGNIIRTLHR